MSAIRRPTAALAIVALTVCTPELAPDAGCDEDIGTERSVSDSFEARELEARWQVLAGRFTNAGGSALGLAEAGLGIAAWRGARFGSAQFAEAEIASDPVGERGFQVAARIQPDTRERYGFLFCECVQGPPFQIKRDGLPDAPVLASASGTLRPGDVIRIEVRGAHIRGLVNGVELLAVTDTARPPLCGGQPGLAVRGEPGAYFERWSAGALETSEPTPPSSATATPRTSRGVTALERKSAGT